VRSMAHLTVRGKRGVPKPKGEKHMTTEKQDFAIIDVNGTEKKKGGATWAGGKGRLEYDNRPGKERSLTLTQQGGGGEI